MPDMTELELQRTRIAFDHINRKLDFVIDQKLDEILRRLTLMAVDQATFDQALANFTTDLDAGLQAISQKLASLGTPVDLTAELATITNAKATFDAAVTDTAPAEAAAEPAAPAEEPAPPAEPAA